MGASRAATRVLSHPLWQAAVITQTHGGISSVSRQGRGGYSSRRGPLGWPQ